MTNLNIVAVYAEDYPWDVRVEKLLRGFSTAGHRVRLVCRNLKRRALVEDADGIPCYRALGPDLPGPLNAFASTPAPINPFWRRAIRRACRGFAPDLLMVRDLPLAPLVIDEARRIGVPALVDMAENHPAMWQNVVNNDRIRLRSWLLKNPGLARRMEKQVAGTAAGIFVVVEEMREHLLRIGAPADRVHLVSNTPPRTVLDHRARPEETSEGFIDLIYVGNVRRSRGLHQVVDAMAQLPAGHPPVRFHIVGTGTAFDSLGEQSRRLGLEDRVIRHGWVNNQDVPALAARCHVGMIPHLKNEHTDTTVPNKLFDFMAAGLPVVVSDATPMKRIVNDLGCGLAFDSADPGSLPRCLQTLADAEVRLDMGRKGREAVAEHYHWDADLARALGVVEKLGSL